MVMTQVLRPLLTHQIVSNVDTLLDNSVSLLQDAIESVLSYCINMVEPPWGCNLANLFIYFLLLKPHHLTSLSPPLAVS